MEDFEKELQDNGALLDKLRAENKELSANVELLSNQEILL